MTDDEFWRIVESDSFQDRWPDAHPLLKDNGGVDYYNEANLRERLLWTKKQLLKSYHGRQRWGYRNGIRVIESWLEQVKWINRTGRFSG